MRPLLHLYIQANTYLREVLHVFIYSKYIVLNRVEHTALRVFQFKMNVLIAPQPFKPRLLIYSELHAFHSS